MNIEKIKWKIKTSNNVAKRHSLSFYSKHVLQQRIAAEAER